MVLLRDPGEILVSFFFHATEHRSADRFVAFALAGRARMAYQLGDVDGAVKDVLASFERDTHAAGARDGA